MNKPLRIFLFIAMSAAIAQLTLLASFAQETIGLKSEASTLENIYREKITAFLNNLVDAKNYTLIITANLRNDEDRLKEYHEALEKKFLPGLAIQDPHSFSDVHNILLDLKQSVKIQVILAENVPADRDLLIKDAIRTNLHLIEEGGDSVNIVRAAKNSASLAEGTTPQRKFSDFSSRSLLLLVVLLLGGLSVLGFWLYRSRTQEEKTPVRKDFSDFSPISAPKEVIHEVVEKEVEVKKTPEQIEAEQDALHMRLAFSKGELIKLAKDYSSIVCRAAEEFFAQGKIQETVTFLEALGWDQSKSLFKEIDSRIWTRIGASLRERQADPNDEEVFNAVHVFHRFALSFVLERAGRDSDNPFSFIFHLSGSEKIDLLNQEKAENIALISIYCSGSQMGELLSSLDSSKQHEVLFNISQIRQLPEAQVKESVDALLSRLENIKTMPSVHVDGPTLAADFIRSLPPIREEELYQTLIVQHPEEAEKIRRVRVMFQDIPYYPTELVSPIIEGYETEELTRALVGFEGPFVEVFLNLIPTKKAMMIQNDLFHLENHPPTAQCAEARRKICARIENEFETKRFSIIEFWKQFEQKGSAVA